MIIQNVVWIIALTGMGLIALGFIYVIWQAGRPASDEATRRSTHTAHVIRRYLFITLLVIFIGGTYGTLRNFPIPLQHSPLGIQQVVEVVGQQWSWQIEPNTIRAGTPVEFRVTSKDVNHGFAIYALNNRIVAQTQAMPGVINKLVYTFTEPGTYKVMCLEYCGLGHAPMIAEFTVTAENTAEKTAENGE